MRKILSILLLAFVGILSLCCFAACGEDGGGTHTGGGTNYVPNENSHLLKEGETVCEHCGEQLFEGKLVFALSDDQTYYKVTDLDDASGDVIVPDYYCIRKPADYPRVFLYNKRLKAIFIAFRRFICVSILRKMRAPCLQFVKTVV